MMRVAAMLASAVVLAGCGDAESPSKVDGYRAQFGGVNQCRAATDGDDACRDAFPNDDADVTLDEVKAGAERARRESEAGR